MTTDYYDATILLLHVILGIESAFCCLIFIKSFSFAKAPKKWNFLIVFNFGQIALITYCAWYCYLEYDFITHYYEDARFYFYEVYAMSMQIIFMAIFVLKYYERRDNGN